MSREVRSLTVARKSWRCADCRQLIQPGHTYAKWTSLPGHDCVPAWWTLRNCAECERTKGRDVPITAAWPSAVMRSNGRPYQPKFLRVEVWENEWATHNRDHYGAIVLGTHDFEVARPLAEKAIRNQFDDDLRPVDPHTGWYRLVPRNGDEWQWDHDRVRGAAGVWWSADYAPAEVGDPTP